MCTYAADLSLMQTETPDATKPRQTHHGSHANEVVHGHSNMQRSHLSVAVASSDSDMQQLLSLGPWVGWLELLQQPGQLTLATSPRPQSSSSKHTAKVNNNKEHNGIHHQDPGLPLSKKEGEVFNSTATDGTAAPGNIPQVLCSHVAHMDSYAWEGSMTWLPVCMHHAANGKSRCLPSSHA